MKQSGSFLTLVLASCLAAISAAPAQAQASRTWVSGVGDDANPCSRTAPCKTFAGAISKTAPTGIINCIDPGGFGGLSINKAITVDCTSVEAGVLAAFTNGIVVNAGANDVVTLRGLDIDGLGTGLVGIQFNSGAALHVQNSVITNFRAGNASGIRFTPSTASELSVTDTAINNNGTGATGAGIQIQPTGAGSALVTLRNLRIENNPVGFRADSGGSGGRIVASIAHTMSAGNSFHGIVALTPAGGAPVTLMLDNVTSANNAQEGIRSVGPTSIILMGHSTVVGNGIGVVFNAGGQVLSYGNNRIDGNVANGANPPTNSAPMSMAADDIRRLDNEAAKMLRPGDEHYRAYVGPPDQYDFMGATQFRLLAALGLREHHSLLDFGCGSLRAGRLFIPYLLPGRYFGLEPNRWLIDDAVEREIGHDLIRIKQPTFLHDDGFSAAVFGATFDFILAQSVFSHAGQDLIATALASFRACLVPSGLALATFIPPQRLGVSEFSGNGWIYPGCVTYEIETVLDFVEAAGLVGRQLPWFHPRQTWFALAHSEEQLPAPANDAHLSGAVLRAPDLR